LRRFVQQTQRRRLHIWGTGEILPVIGGYGD
jgi:hypothetical protein